MNAPTHLPMLSREARLAVVVELQRQSAAWRASHEAWRAEIDELKRGGPRQAAPLSRGTRVTDPKPPGRKPGSGTFRYREVPPPETLTEPPVAVPVTRAGCPTCGGPLAEERVDCV